MKKHARICLVGAAAACAALRLGAGEEADGIVEGRHTYTPKGYIAPTSEAVKAKVEWYRDQKLALMVHFGIYSQPGIKESWCLVDDRASWARLLIDWKRGEDFKREYWSLNRSFNPVRFQPEAWADVAARNGFRYAIVTTKHHDGFCLFDSRYSDYKVTAPDCPFSSNPKADVIRELHDAFRARGLGIACYFSKPDWHHEDYWENHGLGYGTTCRPSYDVEKNPGKWKRYAAFVRNQILELVREYGPLDALWLDGGVVHRRNGLDIDSEGIVAEARKITPDLVVVDRGGKYTCEDVITPEEEVPPAPLDVPWESCITMGTGWSYRYDDAYKSPRELIHLLVDVVVKGGNLALNVGAAPDGRLPKPAVDRMDAMGAWLGKNGEAIYGTRIQPPYLVTGYAGSVGFTKKGDNVYAIRLWNEGQFDVREITVAGIGRERVGKVVHLATSRDIPFRFVDGALTLDVPEDLRLDPFADAFRIEPPSGFDLVRNGRSRARIRPSGNAQVDRDVAFFTNAVFRSTGALLDAGENEIAFEVERRAIPEEDAYEVVFPSPHEMLVRGTETSCRWALNEILERDMGVCFCFPGPRGAHYPRLETVSVPLRTRRGDAAMKLYRELYLEDPAWSRALGGKSQKGNFYHHNLFELFPVEKYGRPPWRDAIMPLVNGVRKVPSLRFDAWQPCMASQASVDEAVKNILEHLRRHPDQKVYSLGMNDNGGWCQCDGCRAMNGGTFDEPVVYGSPRHRSRSRVYYAWVNKVADGVAKVRPDVMLGLLAYNEIVDPPPFRVRDSVVPGLCRSVHQTIAPSRRASYEAWMKAWGAKCRFFGVNDYAYGARFYAPPRMYVARADEFLRLCDGEIPAMGGYFAEGSSFIGEGPKRWMLLKRAFDATTPKDELLGRWYDACCGKSAAPYLKAYYDKWEAFWTGEALRQTQWYSCMTNGAGYCDFNSTQYLTALTQRDFAEGTALMDKVVAAALADGDADQRERARRLRRFDDFYVARARAGGLLCPRMFGGIRSAADACEFLAVYPAVMAMQTNAAAIAAEIVAEKRREPFANSAIHENGMLVSVQKNALVLGCAGVIPLYADDPKVRAAIGRAMEDPRLPASSAALLGAYLNPERVGGRNWLWTKGLDDEGERRLWSERDDYGFEVSKIETQADGDRRMTLTARRGWQAAAKNVSEFPSGKFCIYTVRVTNPLGRPLSVELVAGGTGVNDVRTNFPVAAGASRTCTIGFKTPLVKGGLIKWPLRFYVTTGGVPVGKSIYVDRMAVREID